MHIRNPILVQSSPAIAGLPSHGHTWVHPCSCLHFPHLPLFACQENCLRYCNFPFWLLHFNNWMGQWLESSFVWHVRHKVSVWAIAYRLPATPLSQTAKQKGACVLFFEAVCAYICLNCIECLSVFHSRYSIKQTSYWVQAWSANWRGQQKVVEIIGQGIRSGWIKSNP